MLFRVLAGLIGIFDFMNGLSMVLAPLDWFNTTSGVIATGPFNSHLVTDVGLGYLAGGLALMAFAVQPSWRLAAFGASAFLSFHGLFHLIHVAGGHGRNWGTDVAVAIPALLGIALCWPKREHAA
ncbi:MAG TPA: hypothetical protein VF489_13515 [Sphingobium sp.]